MPDRITLKRTKGWRMPENTKKVSRGLFGIQKKYGNPFELNDYSREQSLAKYRIWLLDKYTTEEIKADLKGFNLACWCKPGDACHADILLEIANR